jgi:hypothetical protein
VPSDGLLFVEEEGSYGSRGQVHGHISLLEIEDDLVAYLDVNEIVLVEDGHAHREEYAYYLIINDVDLWGHERDPQHAPHDVHCHPRTHVDRYPCEPISLKGAVELAWEHVSEVHKYGLPDDYDPMREEA